MQELYLHLVVFCSYHPGELESEPGVVVASGPMGLADAAIGDTGGALGAEYVGRLWARALLSQVDSV